MEFMLDTADLKTIEACLRAYPISGVTCNPSILKAQGKINFFRHFKELRQLIGFERSLHIQVVADECDGMVADAQAILDRIDDQVYIKVPVTEQGLEAIKRLKAQKVGITATAIYTKMQGFLATAAGADYIAVYCNRMENIDADPYGAISSFAQEIRVTGCATKILAASFKNLAQVNAALTSGSHAVTVPPELLRQSLSAAPIRDAVTAFQNDWRSVYKDRNISEIID